MAQHEATYLDRAAVFIGRWEGCLLEAYLDTIASPPVWTIGFGWTGKIKKNGRWRSIRAGDRFTQKEADAYLSREIRKFAHEVNKLIKVPVSRRMRMMLISLAYNIGLGAFASSTLLRKLNRREYWGAAQEFPKWSFAGGVQIEGLLNRRRDEQRVFIHYAKGKRLRRGQRKL